MKVAIIVVRIQLISYKEVSSNPAIGVGTSLVGNIQVYF